MPHSTTSSSIRFWDAIHNRAMRNINTLRDQTLAPFGVSAAEWFVLDIVYATREVGIRVGDIARAMDVQTTYIALVLRHLQAKKLVKTTPDKHDRRVHRVELTNNGKDVLHKSEIALVEAFADQLGNKNKDSEDLAAYMRMISILSSPEIED